MKIWNLNPAPDIGASAWLVESEGHRLLLDAGFHPKREGRAGLPLYGLIRELEVDAIALSHCHYDHVGSLPLAMQYFPQAHVLLTELSYFLVERVLHNSVNVMQRQREELGLNEYPLYTHKDVDDLAARFQGYRYERDIEWAGYHKLRRGVASPTLQFLDAGHTLGSAGIMVSGRKETLFYTGDVSFGDQTLLRGARFEDVQADVLILETTRGNREVAPGFTREAESQRLAEAIIRVLKRRGTVLIPAFALGRTQEILGLLAMMTLDGRLRRQPVYIGGLGRVFTEIYDLEAHRSHRQFSALQLHEVLNLMVLDRGQAESMRLNPGRICVMTSGMMTENTVAHDLALRLFSGEEHAICFVGYADPDTPGGRLKVSQPGREFLFSAAAGEVKRCCEVMDFDLTAHANREELLGFVAEVGPRVVVLGHGEPESKAWFEAAIRARFPKMHVVQPGPGEVVEV